MKILVPVIILFCGITTCMAEENSCTGPENMKAKRRVVNAAEQQKAPFGAIAHLYRIKGGSAEVVLGTVSFVNNKFLLGSAHYIKLPGLITQLVLYRDNSDGTKQRLALKKGKDFKIFRNPHFNNRRNDITVFKLTHPENVTSFFKSSFVLTSFSQVKPQPQDSMHLTGYPFDSDGQMIEKADLIKNLIWSKDSLVIGYLMYSCSGDSGAPVWVETGGKYYIIGVHHGGNEGEPGFTTLDYNAATFLNDNLIKWINGHIQ